MPSYQDVAAELRRRIDAGVYAVGEKIPTNPALMQEFGVSKETISKATGLLADDGLVVASKRAGTVVRNRTAVRLPLSRYRSVLAPGSPKGPWESATAAAGLDGEMLLIQVEPVEAPADLAALLELRQGDPIVYRLRHAIIRPDDLVQIQMAWYPKDIAEAAGLHRTGKVQGGAYSALAAAGYRPATASETVEARTPTETEAAQLRIGGRVAVITVERVTRDAAGRPLEVLRAVAPADRLAMTYDDLPLTPT
ncbi:GntR family transcriptional regulator [Streptomyces racemochromogenes]|uniref:GntR family transcriptional regulator n=1 Tax=Streptomyces racemochromogenes TaxID=67353 RepID=UPI0035F0B548